MSISIKNLTKLYGNQKAIDNVSFDISTGEIVGFLGPNGAGKSTTMKILSGYIPQTSGEAYVMGIDVAQDPLGVKKKIGYLPELNPLYGDMYIKEYLKFHADIHHLKNAKKRIEEIIQITGLTLEKSKKIGQLSKGYKQRVGLAQALLNDPDVLILDEPTSGLDPNQMREIRSLILELSKNKTILLSSHIMQEVEALCSRVIIINRGKIVADDKVDTVKSKMLTNRVMSVNFREEIDVSSLTSIQGILSVETKVNRSYRVTADKKVDLAAILFQFAVDQGTIITEQKEEKESLENVFEQLTKNA